MVELAAAQGALVTAVSSSPERGERLLALGAAEVVPDVESAEGPFEVILESVGGLVARGGRDPPGARAATLLWLGQASRRPALAGLLRGGVDGPVRDDRALQLLAQRRQRRRRPGDARAPRRRRATCTPRSACRPTGSGRPTRCVALSERRVRGNAVAHDPDGAPRPTREAVWCPRGLPRDSLHAMSQEHLDRLTAIDASFLHQEGPTSHMHVGALTMFEGPPPPYTEVLDTLRGRLHLVPRYRQKLAVPPAGTGRPLWVDDPSFSLEYHVRHTALPEPGSEEQLLLLAGRIFSQQLDRSKPLWEVWMVEGLEGGGFALITKTHHALIDGIAGVDIAQVIFDLGPVPAEVPHPDEAWEPARTPIGGAACSPRARWTCCAPACARPPRRRRSPRARRRRCARRAWPSRASARSRGRG